MLTGCLTLLLAFSLLAPMIGWAAEEASFEGIGYEDSGSEDTGYEDSGSEDVDSGDTAPGDTGYAELPEEAMPKMSLFTDDQYTKELATGSELGLGDMIYVRFDWEGTLTGLTRDTRYQLFSLPENHLSSAPISQTLYTDGTSDPIAALAVDDAGIVSFTLLTDDANQVYGAYAGIGFALAADKDKADEKGQVEIKLPGMVESVIITVADFKPAPPKLTKAASNISAGGEVTWTVQYTAAESGYEGAIPVKLVDALPDGMEYVADGTLADEAIGADAPVYDAQAHTLTWTILEQADKTFTYQTKLTDAALSALWRSPGAARYENKVAGYDAEETSIDGLSANAAASVDESWINDHTALNKAGTYNQATREITWTVTVKPVSLNFAYLKVIDTMGKGLTLDDSSIKVNGDAESGHRSIVTESDGRTTLTLWLYGDEATSYTAGSRNFTPDGDGNYEITYTTKVSDDYFHHTSAGDDPNGTADIGDADVKNSAKLEWQWLDEGGQPGEATPPAVEKGPCAPADLTNNVLRKKGISYDPATHILTWEVTVNESGLNIQTADFQDLLADDGIMTGADGSKYKLKLAYASESMLQQEITDALSGSNASVSDVSFIMSASGSGSSDCRNVGFTCKISNVTNKITFPVQAEVIDASFWAVNQEKISVKNEATLRRITLDGSKVLPKTFTASAFVSPFSQMLSKTHIGFTLDSADQSGYVTWKLTINTNKTSDLGVVTVEDTLPAGMTYVEDSAVFTAGSTTVNGSNISAETTDTPDGQIVTWILGAADTNTDCAVNGKEATLTYWTKVNFDMQTDGNKAFLTKNSIGFQNAVELWSEVYSAKHARAVSTAQLDNTVLSKSQQVSIGNKVSYTVALNPYGISIASSDAAPLYLEDRMPAGLALDLDSVRLYQAGRTVKKSSDSYGIGMDKGNQVPNPKLDYKVEKTALGETQNVLTILVEDRMPYVLTYDAYIVQTNVELKNEIAIFGSAMPVMTGLGNNAAAVRLASFGGAKRLPGGNWALEITKTDTDGKAITFTPQQIAAGSQTAVFGLYTAESDAAKLLEAACDPSTGVCTFSQPVKILDGVNKLYLKELTPPTGYALNSGWLELTAEQLTKLKSKGTVSFSVENEKNDTNKPIQPDTPGNGGNNTQGGTDTPGGGGGMSGGTGTPGGGGGTSGGTGTPGGGGTGGGSGTPSGGDTPAASEVPGSSGDPADPSDAEDNSEDDEDKKDDKGNKHDKDKKKDKDDGKSDTKKKPGKDKNSGKTNGSGKSDKTSGSQSSGESQSISESQGSGGMIKPGSDEESGTKVSNVKQGVQDSSETVDGVKQTAIPQTGQDWYRVVLLTVLGIILLSGTTVISALHEKRMSEKG